MSDPLSMMRYALWLAGHFSMHHGLQAADLADCRQEAALACLQAFLRYNPDLGPAPPYVRISVLHSLSLWNHRRRIVRLPDRFRRLPQPIRIPLDEDPVGPDPEEDVDDSFKILHRFMQLVPHLATMADRALTVRLLAGQSLSQAAREMGVSRQASWVRKRKILRQLKALWWEH